MYMSYYFTGYGNKINTDKRSIQLSFIHRYLIDDSLKTYSMIVFKDLASYAFANYSNKCFLHLATYIHSAIL